MKKRQQKGEHELGRERLFWAERRYEKKVRKNKEK